MSFKVGQSNVSKYYIGTSPVSKIYQGGTEIYTSGPSLDDLVLLNSTSLVSLGHGTSQTGHISLMLQVMHLIMDYSLTKFHFLCFNQVMTTMLVMVLQ